MRALFYYTAQQLVRLGARVRRRGARARGARRAGHRRVLRRQRRPSSRSRARGSRSWRCRRAARSPATRGACARCSRERFVEVVFLHTEREQLVASSAMRHGRARRGDPPHPGRARSRASGASTQLAGTDRRRRGCCSPPRRIGRARRARPSEFVAPLGVDVVEGGRHPRRRAHEPRHRHGARSSSSA